MGTGHRWKTITPDWTISANGWKSYTKEEAIASGNYNVRFLPLSAASSLAVHAFRRGGREGGRECTSG
eukprot:219099-Rhodomonas_salina.2